MMESSASRQRVRRDVVRRWVVRMVVFLLLGAVVNVAVAWGCAAFLNLEILTPRGEWAFSEDYPPGFDCSIERRQVPGAIRMTIIFSDHHPQPPPSQIDRVPIADGPRVEAFAPAWSLRLTDPPRFQLIDGRGWPLASLWCELNQEAVGTPIHPIGGIVLSNSPRAWKWDYRVLPYLPIWPGFAVNSVFYAVIFWLLFATPFTLRRWWRVRKGLCPKCAYPVGENDVCTECVPGARRRKA